MNNVLFGDTFNIIKQFLLPIELYQLSQSCKKYDQLITENAINKNTIDEMMNRLRIIFGDDFLEFMQILRELDAKIVGSFIAQCMLGETWTYNNISIYVEQPVQKIIDFEDDYPLLVEESFHDHKNNMIRKFLTEKSRCGCESTGQYLRFPIGNNFIANKKYVPIQTTYYIVNGTNIKLILSQISAKKYVYAYCIHNTNKNIYRITLNELYVHKMHEIFTKCTNLYSCEKNIMLSKKTFFGMYHRGFKFYMPGDNKNIMSNDSICNLVCKMIKINCRKPPNECEKIIKRYNHVMIKHDILYCVTNLRKRYSICYIDTTSPYYVDMVETVNDDARIHKCEYSCITKLLCPELVHYHLADYDIINNDEYDSHKDFILVPDYKKIDF